MNFLSIFVLIPLLMLAGLWAARGIKAIRGVMVTGASALLIASVVLTFMYLGERSAGSTAEMLFRADTVVYGSLRILYIHRLIHHVHVLRNRADSYVPADRCMGFGT